MRSRICIGSKGKACPWKVDLTLEHGRRLRCPECAKKEVYRNWHARHLEAVKHRKRVRHNAGYNKGKTGSLIESEACRKAREVSAEVSNPKAANKLINLLINAVD